MERRGTQFDPAMIDVPVELVEPEQSGRLAGD